MAKKMYDEKKKKDAETNKSNQIKSNQNSVIMSVSMSLPVLWLLQPDS